MPRNKTDTVEYFPHIAKPGKTLFILEGKYGNDGYAFWFKLLEILAASEGHFYDASQETEWQYLVARARITDVSATEILTLLANLGNIDADLWKNHKIIWCQALVDNVSEVYRKRKRPVPNRPKPNNCDRNKDFCARNAREPRDFGPEKPQSKVKESKVLKDLADSKKSADPPPKANGRDFEKEFREQFYPAYPNKKKPGYALQCYIHQGKRGRLPPIEDLLKALEEQKTWPEWTRDGGRYIDHPSTWINGEGWKNQRTVSPQATRSSYAQRPGHHVIEND